MRSQHFGSIHEVLNHLRSEVPDNPFARTMKDGQYVWARDGDEGRLIPSPASPFWSPFLYRGQAKRYPTCVPGVFRGLSQVDHPQKLSQLERAKCFLARVRLEEFLLALPSHPAYQFSREHKLVVSSEALAQHYELATDRIDLSQDPEVAAFFATNWRDENGQWHPMVEGKGVLYRVDLPRLRNGLGKERNTYLEWIGKQAWPRPGEQKAWTLRLPLGEDFEQLPFDAFTFDHQERSSVEFNEKFAAGAALFPPDVLSEMATAIHTSTSIARCVVSQVLTTMGCDADEHARELEGSVGYFAEHFGVDVLDREPIQLSPEQLTVADDQVSGMKQTFFNDCRVMAVRSLTESERAAHKLQDRN